MDLNFDVLFGLSVYCHQKIAAIRIVVVVTETVGFVAVANHQSFVVDHIVDAASRVSKHAFRSLC